VKYFSDRRGHTFVLSKAIEMEALIIAIYLFWGNTFNVNVTPEQGAFNSQSEQQYPTDEPEYAELQSSGGPSVKTQDLTGL
jgi:hypothetical protein